MALTDKLTAIGNAIREKNGESNTYTLAQMPEKILELQGVIDIIPSYVKEEARRVINTITSYQNNNTVTFLAISDPHQMVSESTETNIQNNKTANHHAGLAMKVIAQACDIDFAAMLGDYSWGASNTTIADGLEEIKLVNKYIDEAFSNIPNFRTVGNHDALLYSYNQNGDYLKPSQLYELIGKYNEGAVVDSANPKRGYCYRDFTDKKLRVICLNTAEGEETGTVQSETWRERVSTAQMAWFASTLDLSAKSDCSQWQILILSHHPIDWGTVSPLTKVVNAYVKGIAVSFTHGTHTVSHDYSGKNGATIIANIHGHVHCYKTDSLYLINNGVGTSIDNTRRVAVPNSCFTRANEYGENGKTDVNGIEYGETTSYEKTANNAEDTAFCVFVIDLSAKVIRAFHYGAGIDRTINYSEVINTHTVTNDLANVITNNNITSTKSNETYTATLTPTSGYIIDSVTVTMGGIDVTSSVYSNGVITIANPTGDIVITASAILIPVVNNVLATAEEYGSTAVYNGVGYKDGKYLSTSAIPYEGTDANFFTTGYIPYEVPETGLPKSIYIKGAVWTTDSHARMNFFKDNKTIVNAGFIEGTGSGNNTMSTYFAVETLGANYIKLTPIASGNTSVLYAKNVDSAEYFRMSLKGSGSGVIITIDEPIE